MIVQNYCLKIFEILKVFVLKLIVAGEVRRGGGVVSL